MSNKQIKTPQKHRTKHIKISPGWIDTACTVYEGPDATQQPVGRVGNPMDIACMVLYHQKGTSSPTF